MMNMRKYFANPYADNTKVTDDLWLFDKKIYTTQKLFFKGDSKPATQTQKTEPWAEQAPYLKEGFAKAKSLFLDPAKTPTYFPQSTVADFSPDTLQAMDMVRSQVRAGSPVSSGAQQMIGDTLAGKYLYGGDAFNAALGAAERQVLPNINSMYAKAGRYGSGLAQTAQTQALGDAFAGQYAQERANQMQAAGMAPQISDMRFADAKALGGIGETQFNQDQAKLDDLVARQQFEQNIQGDQLAKYMNIIQGNYGGTETASSATAKKNKTSAALGGALSGAATGAAVGGPWGAAIGGGVGLLSGFM